MRLFRKRDKKEIQVQPGKDRLAGSIAGWILKVQNGFAKFMNKRTEKISISGMKVMLIIFLLSGSGLSIYVIAKTVLKKGGPKIIKIYRISTPQNVYKNSTPGFDRSLLISKDEYEEIQSFHSYMDSLHQSKSGKPIYDSILLNRPGMMDSIIMIEELYRTTHKKNSNEKSN